LIILWSRHCGKSTAPQRCVKVQGVFNSNKLPTGRGRQEIGRFPGVGGAGQLQTLQPSENPLRNSMPEIILSRIFSGALG
jgi:hypothetical protein